MTTWIARPVLNLAWRRAERGRETTAAAAVEGCGVAHSAAQRALALLARHGLLERRALGRYTPTAEGARLAREKAEIVSGPAGPQREPRRPRRNTFQARLWAALRQLRKATVPELIQIAATGAERDPPSTARPYLKALIAAGYVTELRRRTPGTLPNSNGFKQYLLARDPGPRAPVLYRKRGRLRDPNSGKVCNVQAGAGQGSVPCAATQTPAPPTRPGIEP